MFINHIIISQEIIGYNTALLALSEEAEKKDALGGTNLNSIPQCGKKTRSVAARLID